MDIQQIILLATEVIQEAGHATEAAGDLAQAVDAAHQAETGPLGALGIDIKLFIAQLVNFIIVLFVVWKWIVKPLGKTLSERQEKIESGLKNATYMEEEKQKFETWKKDEMQKVRNEAEKVLKTASDTAEKIKQETVNSAQTQADKIIEQAKTAVENEKTQMLKEVKANVAELVVMASEKILKSKLDHQKDQDLVRESIKEMS